jgi:hypothetical protein
MTRREVTTTEALMTDPTTEEGRAYWQERHDYEERLERMAELQCPIAYDHDPDQDFTCGVCGWSPDQPVDRMSQEEGEGIKAWITALNGACSCRVGGRADTDTRE